MPSAASCPRKQRRSLSQRLLRPTESAGAAAGGGGHTPTAADLVVIVQSCSPYKLDVYFDDNLADLFRKMGQSMLVACGILRDELMWKVSQIQVLLV